MSDHPVERLIEAAEQACAFAGPKMAFFELERATTAASAWLSSHKHDREEILESLDGWRQRAEKAESSHKQNELEKYAAEATTAAGDLAVQLHAAESSHKQERAELQAMVEKEKRGADAFLKKWADAEASHKQEVENARETCAAMQERLEAAILEAEKTRERQEKCKHGKMRSNGYCPIGEVWMEDTFERYTSPYCPDCGKRLEG